MDELTQMLLSQLADAESPTPTVSLPDMVERWLSDDPIAGPLASALRQREANLAAADVPMESALTDPEVAEVVERIYAELGELRLRMRRLADALGACPRCWGEDALCVVCHGRGHSGGRQPDTLLFSELVEPAWRRHSGWAEMAQPSNSQA